MSDEGPGLCFQDGSWNAAATSHDRENERAKMAKPLPCLFYEVTNLLQEGA